MELEIGPAHVSKHYGRFDNPRIGFDNEAVLALLRGRDDEAVRHLAEIAGVSVGGLKKTQIAIESSSCYDATMVIQRPDQTTENGQQRNSF